MAEQSKEAAALCHAQRTAKQARSGMPAFAALRKSPFIRRPAFARRVAKAGVGMACLHSKETQKGRYAILFARYTRRYEMPVNVSARHGARRGRESWREQ